MTTRSDVGGHEATLPSRRLTNLIQNSLFHESAEKDVAPESGRNCSSELPDTISRCGDSVCPSQQPVARRDLRPFSRLIARMRFKRQTVEDFSDSVWWTLLLLVSRPEKSQRAAVLILRAEGHGHVDWLQVAQSAECVSNIASRCVLLAYGLLLVIMTAVFTANTAAQVRASLCWFTDVSLTVDPTQSLNQIQTQPPRSQPSASRFRSMASPICLGN